MKKTLLITEEERKRISILHENAIKRQHLVEEAPPPFQYNAAQMISAGNQNTQYSAYPVNQNDLNTEFINKTNQQYVNSGNNTAADSNTTTTTTKAPATSNNTSKSNSKVQEIQKKLIELGYGELLGPKKDDGVLGKNTYNAILSALSSTPKLTTNTVTNQPNQAAGTATSSSSSGGSTTPAATGGSTTPAATGGSTTPAATGGSTTPAATGGNTPQVTNQVANKTKEQPKNTQDFDNEIE